MYKQVYVCLMIVYSTCIMAKRAATNTKNKASRSKKTKKRLAIKAVRKAAKKKKK